ncbi:UPF0481 protein At3g47200-like isoform X2 [Ricinus communis]|uniref:UPF0481 protein At3g47200-like isoform X2 n=1 Tax=Ricinus communis TaxID=3988 RepID=UPI00201A401D|nr:UPF0481 protein At3g47200-like isoform X2 [Ricinus communis]
MGKNVSASSYTQSEHQCQDPVIDIPENLEVALRPEICIYKVLSAIRKINEAVYNPQVISIGPIHHGKPEFKDMEKQKLIYLKEFCRRVEGRTEKEVISDLSRIINECEGEIRHCYAETFTICSSEFVKMILVDAVFIIELFLRNYNGSEYENDFIIGQPSLKKVVYLDLALLENQLPYFILEKLYDSIIGKFQEKGSVAFHMLLCFFYELPPRNENLIYLRNKKVKHFPDWARYLLLNVSLLESTPSDSVKLVYNATKLSRAGVKFQVVEDSCSMLDLKFENGVLKMPVFEVYYDLECLMRNLMAFEQCHYPFRTYFYNYFVLMDHLINTAEDVELLVEAGIIVNWLGSNQVVADLINRLCQGLDENTSCYTGRQP